VVQVEIGHARRRLWRGDLVLVCISRVVDVYLFKVQLFLFEDNIPGEAFAKAAALVVHPIVIVL